MSQLKLETSLFIENNGEGGYDIIFKIGSFPTKGLAGQYAIELAQLRDEVLGEQPDILSIEKETMH